jgi:threonine/homoserine/homoserine lactone efflux protein
MPIGPVNAAAISRTLKYSFRYGLAVGIGAAVMDVIYCGGAAQINQFLVASPIINLGFEVIGFTALLLLGIRQLLQLQAHSKQKKTANGQGETLERMAMQKMHLQKRRLLGPFVLGLLLYATNVMAVPEWIIVAGLWRSWGLLGIGFDVNVAFAVGAGLGTAGWFIFLVGWISKRHSGFKPETLRMINFGTAIAMLAFSAYFAYAIVFETHWNQVLTRAKQNTEVMVTLSR